MAGEKSLHERNTWKGVKGYGTMAESGSETWRKAEKASGESEGRGQKVRRSEANGMPSGREQHMEANDKRLKTDREKTGSR